jgi:maleylpyruvate isomerase
VPPALALANYFRSGTSYRVRIGLNLKGIPYAYQPVSLLKGEHRDPAYRSLNPQGLVPALTVDGKILVQSPAILEWLDEKYPDPPLLPKDPEDRAHVRALAAVVGCDIHPLQNMRVLDRLRVEFAADADTIKDWCRHWIGLGFAALEAMLRADTGRLGFCWSDRPSLADCYLVPQIFGARRFGLDLAPFPLIREIDRTCNALKPFADAHPERQPDYQA